MCPRRICWTVLAFLSRKCICPHVRFKTLNYQHLDVIANIRLIDIKRYPEIVNGCIVIYLQKSIISLEIYKLHQIYEEDNKYY